MFYKVEYQKRAHQEVEKIFRVLFPEQGLAVREEQIRLCHEMLDTLLGEQIALCDACLLYTSNRYRALSLQKTL